MAFIHDYFGFNKQQRNGLLVLVVICALLLLIRISFPYFIKPANIIVKDLPLVSWADSLTNGSGHHTESFVFDPNTVTAEELARLGLTEKTTRTFLNFRKKFVFRQKTDVKKVYGIGDSLYLRLEPFIVIYKQTPGHAAKPIVQKQEPKIELNGVDSLTLLVLNGIGPSFARRIIKYRSLLGGYFNIDQLNEVYGFTPELFDKVKNQVYVDTLLVKKIDLNRDDFKTVNRHPYISYELTKTIFDWRHKTRLNAVNLHDILNDEALYHKLRPYLTLN